MSAIDAAANPATLPHVLSLTEPAPQSAPAAEEAPRGAAATGDVFTLAGILIKGFGLTLLTLGIYRFWMKTRVRRWYWSNTVIGGNALEYRGTALELLIGFLIVLGVLLPLYALTAGAVFLSGVVSWEAASNVLLALVLVLAQYALYRARRYRLTRTAWRGVTFAQDGSGLAYVGRFFIGLGVSVLSLGLATPWARAYLEGYKVRHTRFGTVSGSFAPRLTRPFIAWLVLWLPALFLAAHALQTVYAMGGLDLLARIGLMLVGLGPLDPGALAALEPAALSLATGFGAGFAWALLVWPAYRIEEFRAFTAGTTLGPVRFSSAARKSWMYFAHIRLWLSLLLLGFIVFVGAFGLLTSMAGAFVGASMSSAAQYLFLGGGVALYLMTMIGFVVLRELILAQGFWRHALSTLTITGLDETGDIVAKAQADRGLGEGFADAFEVGGF